MNSQVNSIIKMHYYQKQITQHYTQIIKVKSLNLKAITTAKTTIIMQQGARTVLNVVWQST